MSGIGGHASPNTGQSVDWLTPPWIVVALGPFDLDPCAAVDQPWRTADVQWTVFDDGLARPWHGLVWLNPPYGRETGKWVRRLARYGNGIACIFARTETKIFFPWVWEYATAVFFFRGRLHFYTVDGKRAHGNAGGPSVLVAYGMECAARLRVMAPRWGCCVCLREGAA